jgi:hypothetical protein
MTRSNQNRIFTAADGTADVPIPQDMLPTPSQPTENTLHYVAPTEIVDLPSKGKFYPEGHILHNCESIEIRHMTAREEDILTNSSFLRKGIALDRMLQSVMVNNKIKVEDLLIGDKNALLVYSRIYGYGSDYTTKITCLKCDGVTDHSFNLENLKNKDYEEVLTHYDVELTEEKTFRMTLPKSNFEVEFRLLSSRDEKTLLGTKKGFGSLDLLNTIIVSINNQTNQTYLQQAIQSLPILDASVIKRLYGKIMPDIDLTQEIECDNCGESFEMGVPLDAGFFWPDV